MDAGEDDGKSRLYDDEPRQAEGKRGGCRVEESLRMWKRGCFRFWFANLETEGRRVQMDAECEK